MLVSSMIVKTGRLNTGTLEMGWSCIVMSDIRVLTTTNSPSHGDHKPVNNIELWFILGNKV